MNRYCMRPNIIEHSRQVMHVALTIADNLRPDTIVNRRLVAAGALLHDITKTRSLATREPHDESGGELLRSLGFPGIAEIVEQHVILRNFNPEDPLSEKEIIYYSDKRVLHDRIVSLQERLEDLIQRYGVNEAVKIRIRRNGAQALSVEKKIAGFLTIDIETLGKLPAPLL